MFVHRTLPECNGKVTKPARGHLHTFVRFRRLLHSSALFRLLMFTFALFYQARQSLLGKMSIVHRKDEYRS